MTSGTTTGRPCLFAAAARRRWAGRVSTGNLTALMAAASVGLLTVLVRGTPLAGFDEDVVETVNGWMRPRPALVQLFEELALLTHPNVMRAVAVVVGVALWRHGHRCRLVWLVVTMAVGGVLGPTLKVVFGRDRPTLEQAVSGADGYAFPSGHALNSMLLAACLVVLAHPLRQSAGRMALGAGMALLVGVTAVDRIALGVHYVSDVFAGWLLALGVVAATTAGFATWRPDCRRGLTATSPVRRDLQ